MNLLVNHIRDYICDGTPEAVVNRYAQLPELAQASDYGEFDRNVVVLDTETTGFSLNHDELTQIAAARIEKGRVVDWFITFVNPGKPIPDDVAHLTNIHDDDVANAPTPEEALASLVAFVGDAKLVAHNAEFDRNFTTKHPAGYPLLENIWLDSLDMARIALPKMKSHRLIDLVRAFDGPLSTHRADDDVAATCFLYRILLAAIDSMPPLLLSEIARMEDRSNWSTVAVFEYFSSKYVETELNGVAKAAGLLDFGVIDSPGQGYAAESVADQAVEDSAANAAAEAEGAEGAEEAEEAGEAEEEGARLALFDAAAFSGGRAGGNVSRETFSMRALRRERISKLDFRAKPDAKDLDACEPLANAEANPSNPVGIVAPERNEIDEAFSPTGLVGSRYECYETRQEQLDMAQAVARALRTQRNLMVEAGTGVGKSMAYLTPLVLLAVKNNLNVGVATKTNALLDQLMFQELPKLKESLAQRGVDLSYTALKGFLHYPCLRKVERVVHEGPRKRMVGTKEASQAPALAALLSFIEQTEYDDIDSLKIDYRALPRKVITTTSHECLRRKCPFYGASCFVHGSRRKAEASHVVVTNHSLLFCDLAADNGLLPPVRYWAVDEAHGAENEARRAFSVEMEAEEIKHLAQRVAVGESSRSVFDRAERTVLPSSREDAATLFYALTNKAKAAGTAYASAAFEFCAHMRDLLVFDPSKKSKGYESVELWINAEIRQSEAFRGLSAYAQTMLESAEKLVTACQELVAYLEDREGAAVVQQEIAAIAMELKDLIRAANIIFFAPSEAYVYATTLSKKGDRPIDKIEAMPFNVGEILNESLYANTKSVVFASATLAVGESFASFENAMGLNAGEQSSADSLALASSYDFDRQMTVYVAKDIPEPNDPQYLNELPRFLAAAHLAQHGSMLTLFTNRKEMERCYEEVNPVLKEQGLRLICQKWGVSVKGLRDDFLSDEHLSLFALKSFWEGFDAPGATLKGVVIPKLPFAKPTDPLSCERSARDDYAWRNYVLPAAILETKQAAGRLIRRADDRGVLILADKRLLSKSYGKMFLKSLPSSNIQILPMREIVDRLGEDFA